MTRLYFRESIAALLFSIEQLDPMEGPVEMICGWFDDLYLPAEPDFNRQSESFAEWRSCFTDNQLKAIERFHSVFESVVDNLSEDPHKFAKDPKWQELSELAKEIRPILCEKD